MNTPQCYIMHTLPVLSHLAWTFNFWNAVFQKYMVYITVLMLEGPNKNLFFKEWNCLLAPEYVIIHFVSDFFYSASLHIFLFCFYSLSVITRNYFVVFRQLWQVCIFLLWVTF
jgi:hypothetical protein